jgi:hypothetical protein
MASACLVVLSPTGTAFAWDRGQVETFAVLPDYAPGVPVSAEGLAVGLDGNIYVPSGRAGIPGIPIGFHLSPHPAHGIFADRAAKHRGERPTHRRYPENGWSLFGLTQSLRAQGRGDEANLVDDRFTKAWKDSDTTIAASVF